MRIIKENNKQLSPLLMVLMKELLLTTNKVAVLSNLNIIEKYFKDSNDIEHEKDMSPRLL